MLQRVFLHQFASALCLQATTSTPNCTPASVSPLCCISNDEEAQESAHCSPALSSLPCLQASCAAASTCHRGSACAKRCEFLSCAA